MLYLSLKDLSYLTKLEVAYCISALSRFASQMTTTTVIRGTNCGWALLANRQPRRLADRVFAPQPTFTLRFTISATQQSVCRVQIDDAPRHKDTWCCRCRWQERPIILLYGFSFLIIGPSIRQAENIKGGPERGHTPYPATSEM